MDINNERASFEKAMNDGRFFPRELSLVRAASPSGRDEYANSHLQSNWEGWLARVVLQEAVGMQMNWDAVPQAWNDLYVAVNHMMAVLCAVGEMEARSSEALNVVSALKIIDGGAVSQRALDLHEKAHMPLFAATNQALRECGVSTQHPDDLAVDRFAVAMKAKMALSRAKGRSGWENEEVCSADRLRTMMRDHINKGDAVDVGNFAMMLHQRGESTAE